MGVSDPELLPISCLVSLVLPFTAVYSSMPPQGTLIVEPLWHGSSSIDITHLQFSFRSTRTTGPDATHKKWNCLDYFCGNDNNFFFCSIPAVMCTLPCLLHYETRLLLWCYPYSDLACSVHACVTLMPRMSARSYAVWHMHTCPCHH